MKLAEENDFEAKGYAFFAQAEDLRRPRTVRVAAVQNRIVAATTEPVHVQRAALHDRITLFIKAAAASNVNILCLQELWSKWVFFVYVLHDFTMFVCVPCSHAVRFLHAPEAAVVRVCRGR